MLARLHLDGDDIPLHFERVAISLPLLASGWIVAVLCIGAGIVLAAGAEAIVTESAGVLLAGLGGVLGVFLARCRSVETVVTERLLTTGAGPLRRRIPVGFVERAHARPARSWRRLYAGTELVLDIGHDGKQMTVPSDDPDGLALVLKDIPARVSGTARPVP
jgi:hypothetical protein